MNEFVTPVAFAGALNSAISALCTASMGKEMSQIGHLTKT